MGNDPFLVKLFGIGVVVEESIRIQVQTGIVHGWTRLFRCFIMKKVIFTLESGDNDQMIAPKVGEKVRMIRKLGASLRGSSEVVEFKGKLACFKCKLIRGNIP